jgi:ribonuclease P protein component
VYKFNKTKRLLAKKDYDVVFKGPRKIVTEHFIILYRENSISQARLGIALAKKIVKKACNRNRIRRVLREAFRTKTNFKPVDIVFLGKVGLADLDNSTLRKNLEIALGKLSC